MQILIQEATEINRDNDGYPYSWKSGNTLFTATTSKEFYDFVDALKDYSNIVAFTGSASNLMTANAYIAHKLKESQK